METYLTPQVIAIAEDIDVIPLLDNLVSLRQGGRQHTIEFLELRQQLTDRILLAAFEVSSGVAEVVCERDRADQVAHRLDEIDTSRIRGLTLASIVLGGVAAIVSGGIGLAGGATTASDAVEVAGGVFSTMFGVTALFTKSKQEFTHDRNVLSELWNDPPTSPLFSPSIWRFLHRPHKEGKTPREELVAAWRHEGRLGKPGSTHEEKRIVLLLGQGGSYHSTELHARASMLEELEATIQLMHQELELFVREIAKLSAKPDG